MIVLGLTGSIAMGKSTIGAMLREMYIPVHESDHAVHELLKKDSAGYNALLEAFPPAQYPEIYEEGSQDVNRSALGKLIFGNDDLREKLEGILHPLVQQAQADFIEAQSSMGSTMVCLDIPLLFETGADKRVDYTVVASTSPEIQRKRVFARNGMTEEKFQAILARQMSDADKRARADFIIETGVNFADTKRQVELMLMELRG